jgi:hypothetical protein
MRIAGRTVSEVCILDKVARATVVSVLFVAMAMMFASGKASADGWNHDYADSFFDVTYANVDILGMKSYAQGTDVVVELRVRGVIEDSSEIVYWAYILHQGSGWGVYYSNGTGIVYYFGGGSSTSGVSKSGNTLTGIIAQANAGSESNFEIFGYAAYAPSGQSAQIDYAGEIHGGFVFYTSPAGSTFEPGDSFTIIGQVLVLQTGEPIPDLYVNVSLKRDISGQSTIIFETIAHADLNGYFMMELTIPTSVADGNYYVEVTSEPYIQSSNIHFTVKKPVWSLSPELQCCILFLIVMVIVVIVMLVMRRRANSLKQRQQYPPSQQTDQQRPPGL